MAHFRTEIDSRASVSEAFSYVADFSNTRFWDPTVVRARKKSRGPIQEGTRFEVVLSLAGREIEFDYEVIVHERDRRIVLRAETDLLRSTDTIEFESRKNGSRIVYDADLRLLGAAYLFDLPTHLLFQFSGANSAKGLARALDELRQ